MKARYPELFDPKKASIQFRKESAGVYLSTDGRWKIHSTKHEGRMCGASPVRWWVTDLSTGQNLSAAMSGWIGSYYLTLGDAVEGIHRVIGRAIRDAFEVWADYAKEVARAQAAADKQEALIRHFENLVDDWLCTQTVAMSPDEVRSLAEYLAGGKS